MNDILTPDDVKEDLNGMLKILIGTKILVVNLYHQLDIFEQ